MRRFVWLLLLCPALVLAQPAEPSPRWSLELKGGRFYPDVEEWSRFYGQDYATQFGVALAYKVHRRWELGLAGERIKDEGRALAPTQGILTGNVTYELFPLHAYLLWRGVFSEEQWLVPYLGGGWTRMNYRQSIENQGRAEGAADGYHLRGGVQLLLDRIDPSAARRAARSMGVHNTYFTLEAMQTSAEKGGVELGGVSYLLGVLFEF